MFQRRDIGRSMIDGVISQDEQAAEIFLDSDTSNAPASLPRTGGNPCSCRCVCHWRLLSACPKLPPLPWIHNERPSPSCLWSALVATWSPNNDNANVASPDHCRIHEYVPAARVNAVLSFNSAVAFVRPGMKIMIVAKDVPYPVRAVMQSMLRSSTREFRRSEVGIIPLRSTC